MAERFLYLPLVAAWPASWRSSSTAGQSSSGRADWLRASPSPSIAARTRRADGPPGTSITGTTARSGRRPSQAAPESAKGAARRMRACSPGRRPKRRLAVRGDRARRAGGRDPTGLPAGARRPRQFYDLGSATRSRGSRTSSAALVREGADGARVGRGRSTEVDRPLRREDARARGNPDDTIPDVGTTASSSTTLAIAYVKLNNAGGALDAYFRMRNAPADNGALYRDIAALQTAVGQTERGRRWRSSRRSTIDDGDRRCEA